MKLEELVPLIASAAMPMQSLPPVNGMLTESVSDVESDDNVENGVENNECFDAS